MKHNLTDITVVLDRSGSMGSVLNDTKGGFDQFIKDQTLVKALKDRYENIELVIYDSGNFRKPIMILTGYEAEIFANRILTELSNKL